MIIIIKFINKTSKYLLILTYVKCFLFEKNYLMLKSNHYITVNNSYTYLRKYINLMSLIILGII